MSLASSSALANEEYLDGGLHIIYKIFSANNYAICFIQLGTSTLCQQLYHVVGCWISSWSSARTVDR